MVARGWGREGPGQSVFKGFRVSLPGDSTILEMGDGDGCTPMRIYSMPLIYTLKIVKMVNFLLHIFYYSKKMEKIKSAR